MKRNHMRWGCTAILSLFAAPAQTGTVTAEKVVADEVLTLEIGARPPPDGILTYLFDENGGNAIEDTSGEGNNGVASGCVWTSAGHRSTGAMSFNGTSGFINAGQVANFPALSQYSVSLWFLHDGGGDFSSGYGHKMLDKTSMYHDWKLALHYWDGSIGFGIYEGGANIGIGDGSINYMDNAWHHVAVVRNGPDAWFWVDGELKSTCGNMFSVYSSSDVCIGNSFSGDFYQRKSWSGLLDQVRIFDRTLSPAEVVALYTEGSPLASVTVTAGLAVSGGLSVTGQVSFASGVLHSRPLGDLSCGSYTNAP